MGSGLFTERLQCQQVVLGLQIPRAVCSETRGANKHALHNAAAHLIFSAVAFLPSVMWRGAVPPRSQRPLTRLWQPPCAARPGPLSPVSVKRGPVSSAGPLRASAAAFYFRTTSWSSSRRRCPVDVSDCSRDGETGSRGRSFSAVTLPVRSSSRVHTGRRPMRSSQ